MFRISLALLAIIITAGHAVAQCAAVPNNLTNGTTADATAVMTNFNYILACINQKTSGLRNRIINGNFAVNQRGYAGTGLSTGAYAHDRWKAGASGATYTFVQSKPDTSVTITAGTLQQVVEDVNVEGGIYTLAWTGSAQGRVGISGAAPSGSYASSPIAITGATAGQTITVEFNAGSLGLVQLEPSTTATPFERRTLALETALCQRYYERVNYGNGDVVGVGTVATAFSPPNAQYVVVFWKVPKRATPTINSSGAATFSVAGITASSVGFGGNPSEAWGNFQASSGNTGFSWTAVQVTSGSGGAWIDGNSEL